MHFLNVTFHLFVEKKFKAGFFQKFVFIISKYTYSLGECVHKKKSKFLNNELHDIFLEPKIYCKSNEDGWKLTYFHDLCSVILQNTRYVPKLVYIFNHNTFTYFVDRKDYNCVWGTKIIWSYLVEIFSSDNTMSILHYVLNTVWSENIYNRIKIILNFLQLLYYGDID